MANTYAIYTGDNSTTTFAIPVTNWVDDSHIIVQIATGGARYDSSTAGAYSFSITGSNVVFDTAPGTGVVFIVMRDTLGKDNDDTALDYDFSDGSVITSDEVDGIYRHALFQAQEAVDRVPIYDSGWTSTLEGTALAANQAMTVLISQDVYDTLVWREVKFYGRDSGSPDTFYPIQDSYLIEETAGGTQFSVGIKWNATYLNPLYYITLTTGDYAYASTDAPTILNWVTTIDQIRVVIT